ncbi:hypothetical protein IAT40_001532 [Kwoniella sp. CBS 6097]
MPLYKLTEKRMKKRAREDEQGITQIKAAMREMGDSAGEETDSDESVSGSEIDDEDEEQGWSEDSEDDEDDDEGDEGEEGDDAKLDVDIEGLEDSDEDEDEGAESEVGSEASSSVFPISLEGALTQPIYASGNADDQLCVLCPDKSMKNEHMVKIHLDSKGHKRAAKRYALRLTTNPPAPHTDPREVVDDILADLDSAPGGASTSASALESKKNATEVKEKGEKGGKDVVAGGEKKRKRKMGKKERRAVRAERLLAQAQAGDVKKDGAEEKEGEASGLNRKARRLLARRNGEFGDKPKASKTEKAEVGPSKKQKKAKQ